MRKVIRTGVIGVGKMGVQHARVYAELPGSTLVGVYDPNQEVARACAEAYNCHAFSSLKAFLDAGIEAVSVAVPTSLHAEVAIEALERGLHVLVEKPIAATVEEATAMLRAAEASGRKLMVGHIERFNPAVQAIKAIARQEKIISINITRVGPRPPRIKDTGVIVDLAVHDIDLIHYITEQIVVDVYCVSSSNFTRLEDAAAILLRTDGGVGAQLVVNWLTPYKMREIQMITSNRLVRANLLTQHVQSASRYVSVGSRDQEDGSYLVNDLYIRYREPLKAQLAAFLEAVRRDEVPPVTGEDGLHALEIALRAATFKPASSLQSTRSVAV